MNAIKILAITHIPYIALAMIGIFILRGVRKKLESLNKTER